MLTRTRRLLWPADVDESGLTLVELLVVMLISGIIGAGLVRTFVTTADAVAVGTERSDSLEDIRPAVQRITRELRVADPIVVSSTANFVNEIGAIIRRNGNVYRYNFEVGDNDGDGEFELTETVVELVTDSDGSVTEVPVRSNELVLLIDNGTAAEPVFSYYHEDGTQIDCTGLDDPACKSLLVNARLVKMDVTRQVRNQASPIRLTTSIHIRNVEYDQ